MQGMPYQKATSYYHFDNLIEVHVLSLQLIPLCYFDDLVAKS